MASAECGFSHAVSKDTVTYICALRDFNSMGLRRGTQYKNTSAHSQKNAVKKSPVTNTPIY